MKQPPSESPFHNFVGRRFEFELKYLKRWFEEGHRFVAIVGSAGSGKTFLTHLFSSRSAENFPGGTIYVSASQIENPVHLISRINLNSLVGPSLIIVDEADLLGVDGLNLLVEAIEQFPEKRLIVTERYSSTLPNSFRVLELAPLSMAEFVELMRLRVQQSNGVHLDLSTIERLFRVTHGNPTIANYARELLINGIVDNWDDLFLYFRNFVTTGIVGPDGQPLTNNSKEFKPIIVDVSSTNEKLMALLKKDPKLLWQLPPRKFEEIVAEILDKQGYMVSLTPASGDGGFDIYAAKKEGLGQFLFLVECKRYVPPNKVGVEIVRSLYGVIQAKRATAGAIVTSSYFTNGAEEFQREQQHQLQLHDYIALQRWIGDFPTTFDEHMS